MATTDTDLYRSVMGNDFKATLIKYRRRHQPPYDELVGS